MGYSQSTFLSQVESGAGQTASYVDEAYRAAGGQWRELGVGAGAQQGVDVPADPDREEAVRGRDGGAVEDGRKDVAREMVRAERMGVTRWNQPFQDQVALSGRIERSEEGC